MKAIITDIQRFSLTDGDGIRTTVFFKGCNMSCGWCHNPETLSSHTELMFYENKCIGCGKCFAVCKTDAQKIVDGKHIIDRTLCTDCGACANVCYAGALSMCGKEMSIEDVMFHVRQDAEYYKNSGGGVTLSGGEVLCSREFASALTDACHKEGIRVAVETNLSVPFDSAVSLLSKVDHIMCDIKLFDNEAHRKHTGIPNVQILENVKLIDTLGIPFTVRTPLIPGVTDWEGNITAIAEYIKDLKNLCRYELLNFNPLGEGKYRALNKENIYEAARPMNADKLDALASAVRGVGVPVKVI